MDYDSYLELQKRYSRTISNDYLLPADLKRRFASGVITVYADEHALFLFERREGFSKLHFRLTDTSAVIEPRSETIAAFLTYRGGRSPEASADWLLSRGFVKLKTLRRHTASEITGVISTDGVDYAAPEEAYSLLGEYFSAAEADLPCRELFEGALCVRSQEGPPIGVLYMGQTLVVAVAPEARGLGIGRKLYRAYAAFKNHNGKKNVFHEWISDDNAASLAMFESLGFAPDNVVTDCYVMFAK